MEKQSSIAKLKKQKEVIEKVYKAFETGNTSGLENYVTSNMKEHNPAPTIKSKGIQTLKDQIEFYHTAFPDLKIKIKEIFGDGEKVAVYATYSGTNKGEMMGMPATNKKTSIDGIEIVKFENEKMSEHWGIYDNLEMYKQLGLMPETHEMAETEMLE